MSPSPDPGGAGQRSILVVDDEPTLRLGFAYALSDSATRVESVGSGTEALDRLAIRSFDLVILDLRMPGMDGVAVIDALRKSGNPVPVILCSAVLSPKIVARSIRHGVVDFLLKPILPSDLRETAAAILTPRQFPHSGFWQAARSANLDAAILSLEPEKISLEPRMKVWLTTLQALRASAPEDTASPATLDPATILRLPWNAR